MLQFIIRLGSSRVAATASEYALILGVLAAVIIVGVTRVNGAIYNVLSNTANTITGS